MAKEIYLNGMTADQLSDMIRGVPARRAATAASHIFENRHEVSHAARNRPPFAHLARDAHRLGESR